MTKLLALFVMVWTIGVAGGSTAQTSGTSVVHLPKDIVYKGLPGTPQHVTLIGDPTKPGLYSMLLRVGPNTRIEAHAHPDDRVATVISGTWYFGYGAKFDEKALKMLPPGSFYTEPPNTNHFAMTRAEGVTIQITGTGPSGTSYADPANDPARKK